MKAQVGDRIILAGTRVDDPVRDGEVLEVKGIDGVRRTWSDGATGTRVWSIPVLARS